MIHMRVHHLENLILRCKNPSVNQPLSRKKSITVFLSSNFLVELHVDNPIMQTFIRSPHLIGHHKSVSLFLSNFWQQWIYDSNKGTHQVRAQLVATNLRASPLVISQTSLCIGPASLENAPKTHALSKNFFARCLRNASSPSKLMICVHDCGYRLICASLFSTACGPRETRHKVRFYASIDI